MSVSVSLQPSMGVASASIVEPTLQLLRSLHVDVQHEGEAEEEARCSHFVVSKAG